LAQAQAIAPFDVEAIARVPYGEPVAIKQYLDMGLHTLLVPMVDTARHAADLVRACRYPPHGIRGVSSATSRGADFGLNARYLHEANERVTLIVQIESRAGLDNIEEISAVDGVDALFIGPADLAASLGHIGDPLHSEVQEAIAQAKAAIDRSGKPAGIFAVSVEDARNRIDQGFRFISVGTDIGLLLAGASEVLNAVRSSTPR
jgi:4-hydroxy-2-oxoheptanedioate aldolase